MPRRNTLFFADRRGGAMRHLRLRFRSIVMLAGLIVLLPVGIGLAAKWNTFADIERLRATKQQLEAENNSYRAATGELTAQIQSLETVINDLLGGQYYNPVRVVGFNTAEGWSRDVSEDVALASTAYRVTSYGCCGHSGASIPMQTLCFCRSVRRPYPSMVPRTRS